VTKIAVDPVAGTTGMSVNFVTVEKAGAEAGTSAPAAEA